MEKYDNDVNRKEWVHHFMKFDKDQLYEMNMGVLCGLSLEQISKYANPKMSYLCMRLIKESFLELMPIEKINVFANPNLSYFQMVILKNALNNGLTVKNAKAIANPRFDYDQMKHMIDIMFEKQKQYG